MNPEGGRSGGGKARRVKYPGFLQYDVYVAIESVEGVIH